MRAAPGKVVTPDCDGGASETITMGGVNPKSVRAVAGGRADDPTFVPIYALGVLVQNHGRFACQYVDPIAIKIVQKPAA